MIKRLKNIKTDYLMYIFLGLYLIFMLFFSTFRDMIRDETLYFNETWLMSEVLRQGEWIGNYAVGLHGFLFKIPPALVFLFTGPSITVVTIYTIILSVISGYIFYIFLKKIFKNDVYALLGTLLLLTSFHFVLSVPTYLREIPSMLVVILFMYAVWRKWNIWKMSLIFLLLLDVKEYIFFVFAVFYAIWVFLNFNEKNIIKKILGTIRSLTLVFLPSLLWIILMFTTGLVPVNMFIASLLGLVSGNFSYAIRHFSGELATTNLLDGGRTISVDQCCTTLSMGIQFIYDICKQIVLYIGKLLYPRTFSFISVPKVVMFPVVFSAVLILKDYLFRKKSDLRVFAISSGMVVMWLLFYILRASHGRYLLPILPAVIILLLHLLYKQRLTKKESIWLLVGTATFVLLGFIFETSFILPKIIIELFLFLLLLLVTLKPKFTYLKHIFILLVSAISFGVAMLFSYVQGQVYGYLTWGENREVGKVAEYIPEDRTYWINNEENQEVLSVYTNETYSSPEWKWRLNEALPKTDMLQTIGEQKSYVFPVGDIDMFRRNLKEFNINTVILLVSAIESKEFVDQEYLDLFLKESWLEFGEKVELKNKEMYIFYVTN